MLPSSVQSGKFGAFVTDVEKVCVPPTGKDAICGAIATVTFW
jgi:hypothetical protein